jgi:Ca2+-transporting ATPase
MLQFWNLFNAKAYGTIHSAFHNLRKSKEFLFIALLIIVGQALIIYVGGEMFNVNPITSTDWIVIILFTLPVLLIGEVFRYCKRHQAIN